MGIRPHHCPTCPGTSYAPHGGVCRDCVPKMKSAERELANHKLRGARLPHLIVVIKAQLNMIVRP